MITDHHMNHGVTPELAWEPRFAAEQIGVCVKKGAASLCNNVLIYGQMTKAGRAKSRKNWLQDFTEVVEFRPANHKRKAGDKIAHAALNRPSASSAIPAHFVNVKAQTDRGIQSGVVDRFFQKASAARDNSPLFGVMSANESMTAHVLPCMENIDEDVSGAQLSMRMNGENSKASATYGKAHLAGCVATWSDPRLAYKTTRAAIAGTFIQNDISVARHQAGNISPLLSAFPSARPAHDRAP